MAANEKIELRENKSKRGGARPGAGRKRGKQSKETLARLEVKKAIQERISAHAQRILDAQLTLAQGLNYLYRIDKDEKGKNKRAELVTSTIVIEAYLAGDYDDDKDSYFYITTERPDNRAIDSMFDRAFGKADQKLELEGEVTHKYEDMKDDELDRIIKAREDRLSQSAS